MKNKIIAILIVCIVCLSAICSICFISITSMRNRLIDLQNNQEALLFERESILSENQKYKVQDSLNAVTVSALKLSLETYKKLHTEDAKLIKASKAKQQELERIINAQTEMTKEIAAPVNHTDSLVAFDYKSKWLDINGHVNLYTDSLDLSVTSRDSIIVVESIERKRFLNFLWKTRKIKSRHVDIISKNPYSQIIGTEAILIND